MQFQRGRARNYLCGACGRGYVNMKDLRKHQMYVCGKNCSRFQCPYCPRTSKYRSNIYMHVRTIHPLQDVGVVDLDG